MDLIDCPILNISKLLHGMNMTSATAVTYSNSYFIIRIFSPISHRGFRFWNVTIVRIPAIVKHASYIYVASYLYIYVFNSYLIDICDLIYIMNLILWCCSCLFKQLLGSVNIPNPPTYVATQHLAFNYPCSMHGFSPEMPSNSISEHLFFKIFLGHTPDHLALTCYACWLYFTQQLSCLMITHHPKFSIQEALQLCSWLAWPL